MRTSILREGHENIGISGVYGTTVERVSSPGALAVLAHGQSNVHAAPRAHMSLVEGVVGQIAQADKRLFDVWVRGEQREAALGGSSPATY